MADPDSTRDGDVAVRAQFDWSTTTPSTAVVETVARADGREPNALEPLYEWVDPEALDAVVRSDGATPAEDATVSFVFDRNRVTVRSDGSVVVEPVAETG